MLTCIIIYIIIHISTKRTQESNDMKLFHGSYENQKPEIKVGALALGVQDNVFDGLFASDSENVAESHGNFVFEFEVEKVAESSDLDCEEALIVLAKESLFSDDDLVALLDCVVNDEFDADLDDSNLLCRSTCGDRNAEISWEIQRLRGRIAAHLGFDAVECDDEHGTSYLIVK